MGKASGAKDFLIEKGERVGLGAAGVAGGALLVMGVLSIFSRDQNPAEFAKQIDTKAQSVVAQINAPATKIEDIQGKLTEEVKNTQVTLQPLTQQIFDPNPQPDGKRAAPTVLRIMEGSADLGIVKIAANDIVITEENGRTKITVGVISSRDPKEKNTGSGKIVADLKKKYEESDPKKRFRLPPAAAPGVTPGAAPGGPPGAAPGPGGMARPAGFPGGGPPPAAGGPPPGGMMTPGAGSAPGGANAVTAGKRDLVEYIDGTSDEDLETKMKGRRLAITIAPQRMTVLQAAFPYRAELENYARALKFASLAELYSRPDEMPVFNGVEVQRKTLKPNGLLIEDWTPLPFVENSQPLRAVKLVDKEESADLSWVTLPEENQLVMPLPQEVTGKYPEMKLATIQAAIKKLKDSNVRPNIPAPPSKLSGAAVSAFGRGNLSPAAAGLYGPGGGAADGPTGMPAGSFMLPQAKKAGTPETAPGTATTGKIEPPDYIYIRVFDNDIREGVVYQYRMRAKLFNPNFGKHDLVSKRSDADNKELPVGEEHWYTFPQSVSIPAASYQYAIDARPAAKGQLPPPKPGQALIQVHKFEQRFKTTGDRAGEARIDEPVGDWVIGELLATKGAYLKGLAFAELPFWSSVKNDFELREVAGEAKTVTGKGPKKDVIEARKGVLYTPVPDRTVITADIAGGQVKEKVPNNPTEKTTRTGPIADEMGTEVLLMYQDGSLELKSSAVDKADADRKEREAAWLKWVSDTKAKSGGGAAVPGKTPDV